MQESIKLVRCRLSKKRGQRVRSETRFIPYHEFELWKYFISHQYGYTVADEDLFLWIPQKEYDRKKARLSRLEVVPVNRITLYFFLKKAGVLVSATRFFSEKEYPKVKPLFLKHFEEFQDEDHASKVLEHVKEEKGVCLKNL